MGRRDEIERDRDGRVIDPVTGIVLAGPADRAAAVVDVAPEPPADAAPVVEVENDPAPGTVRDPGKTTRRR